MNPSRPFAATLLAVALAAGPAVAQVPLVATSDGVLIPSLNMTVETAESLDVLGANGQKIGEVDEVIGSTPTTVAALTVDFEDGAGFENGENVAVPADAFVVGPNGLILTLDAASVAALPQWDD